MPLRDLFKPKSRKKYITIPAQVGESPAEQEPQELTLKTCPRCGRRNREEDLDNNYKICPNCSYHYPLTAGERIWLMTDENSFSELQDNYQTADPLSFPGYLEKVEKAREDTGLEDAVVTGITKINGEKVLMGVMDAHFLAGSMGSLAGERVTAAFEKACAEKLPVVLFTASGGARMQEGMLSLMQMAKTSAAVARFHQEGLLYISVLTDPTTGGVTASFATLADIIIAEPGALICFTGPRVIEQTIHQKIPNGFQQAEFLLEHGMIDQIVHRTDLKKLLGNLIALHN
ncbi:MAG: acetyl-CoA carboxylase, carboxyltransferase subunit beta [Syntrophaceticus sp.]|jgi:acetyl-CoA carboxylase carboxyl transferase subunit beta|nr:acetyl-CoA carboxylase, carboxyltransferase subunit beta [Syntrophaceticus sp.]MDD3313977.1 acetyl-CoA carboxylase, carboxyltransferase subunit beta [Syntrophaceticus sp.]MDD4359054.1 acetyl-CoA carboxylase, carboxyltransferase subunit beta [Syntrophaceticus sp.]MDD4783121.1 acetyl-CoA carboxylase, carboxyltransferase subunit beta [Syntrophaceticus sp.]